LGGLIFGWPLMWPTISAERDGDPFEAFSRSFAYVYGKPLHYLFYAIVGCLYGALCLAVVQGAAALVTEFGFWALSWGGGQTVAEIRQLVEQVLAGVDLSEHRNQTLVFGSSLFALVIGLVRTVVTAYMYCFFWCVASAIYLLLRMDVDEKEPDEVYLDQQPTSASSPPPAATGPQAVTTSDSAPASPERADTTP
jgi:hypothetical protein